MERAGGIDPLCVVMGVNCRERRKALGISQSQLAWAVSSRGSARWTAATVSALETGRRNLAPSEMADLLDVLQLSFKELLQIPPHQADGYLRHRSQLLTQEEWQGDKYADAEIDPRQEKERRLQENVWKALKGGHPTSQERIELETMAVEIFGHPLLDERDSRVRDLADGNQPSKAALGHATRTIISELKTHLDQRGDL